MTQLVYILAASHSGSTLLAMLLGAHPEVITAGELAPGSFGNVNEYRCSCRSLFLECPFWQRVAEEMERRATDFQLTSFGTRFQDVNGSLALRLLKPLHRGRALEMLRDLGLHLTPSWRRQYPRLLHNNRTLIEVVSAVSGRRIVVDSSKSAVRLKYLLRIPGLGIKVIRLVRDGRGVSLAYIDPACFADAQDLALQGGGSGADRDDEQLPMASAAREWRRSNEEAEQILTRIDPSDWIEVRYEELCTRTDATLEGIFDFLNLDHARAVRDFRRVEHHVLGNGMRLDSTSKIRLDERWKNVLSDRALQVFGTVAGKMNQRYAYT